MDKIKRWLCKDFLFEECDKAFKDGIENERTENLGLIKRGEQARLHSIDEEVNKKINALLSVVDYNSIVSLDKRTGMVYIGGKRVDEGRLLNLKSEAEFILNSDIWKLVYETPKELAQRQMFVSSESLDDMKKGKSILYTLSTQKNILDTFKNVVAKNS